MNLQQGKILVRLARKSIEAYFSGKTINIPKSADSSILKKKRGAFVTLNLYNRLRGCIGFPEPVYDLERAIIEAARAAAFHDPRFLPLSKEELEDITIEVTVLTKPELIEAEDYMDYLNKIKIGKHGLIIRKGLNSGLLLPQVFVEHNATPLEALEMTCQKAGLEKGSWKDPDSRIYSFSGQIFYETEPYGEVKEKKIEEAAH